MDATAVDKYHATQQCNILVNHAMRVHDGVDARIGLSAWHGRETATRRQIARVRMRPFAAAEYARASSSSRREYRVQHTKQRQICAM